MPGEFENTVRELEALVEQYMNYQPGGTEGGTAAPGVGAPNLDPNGLMQVGTPNPGGAKAIIGPIVEALLMGGGAGGNAPTEPGVTQLQKTTPPSPYGVRLPDYNYRPPMGGQDEQDLLQLLQMMGQRL